jgi:cytoskeleton protein RodZ
MKNIKKMDTPDFFVGARLGLARTKAGISLEKAAKDTRIRVQRLRELETDDFSGFSHPTYARLFLLDYAEYLGIPQDEIRPILPDRAGAAPGGFQYIDALAAGLGPAAVKFPRRRRFRILAALVVLVVFLLLLVAGVVTYLTIKKIEVVARSKPLGELAVPPEAPPEAAPVAKLPVVPEETVSEFMAVGEVMPAQESDSVESFEPVVSPAVNPAPPTP